MVGDRVIYREVTGALAWVKPTALIAVSSPKCLRSAASRTTAGAMDDHYIYVIEEDKKLDAKLAELG